MTEFRDPRPLRLAWDGDDGSFRVEQGHFDDIPEGWKEVEPRLYRPQWPPCRYRQITQFGGTGKIIVKARCALFNQNVDYEICSVCSDYEPPLKYLPPPSKEEYEHFVQHGVYPPDYNLLLEDQGIDPFSQVSEHIRSAQPTEVPPDVEWEPCDFRKERESDCNSCTQYKCDNNEHEKYGKRVYKSVCSKCPLRRQA